MTDTPGAQAAQEGADAVSELERREQLQQKLYVDNAQANIDLIRTQTVVVTARAIREMCVGVSALMAGYAAIRLARRR